LKLPLFFTISFGKQGVKKVIELGNDFDIVHVHSNMALLARKDYSRINSPIVSTLHGTWWGERSTLTLKNIIAPSIEMFNDLAIKTISPMFDAYEDYAIELSNAVIVEGESECRDVGARGIMNLYDRVVRLPPGVDINEFKPGNRDDSLRSKYGLGKNDLMLLCVGRLAGRKGVHHIFDAFKKVLEKEKKVKLLIVGEGPQKGRLQTKAKALGLDGNLVFIGKLPFPELMALYATADIFVYHSLWEGYGLIISEALASGTPVVSSKVGGAPEMITYGKSGYYFEVGNSDKMAEYILKLINDDDLRRKMGKYARKNMVEKYDWRKIVRSTIRLYDNVIDDPRNEKKECTVGKRCF
jgi:glycosyltransferase involved in cell wall biosynthesis